MEWPNIYDETPFGNRPDKLQSNNRVDTWQLKYLVYVLQKYLMSIKMYLC